MKAVIVCQNCKKPLKIPVEGLGKKIRCPACQTVFIGLRDEFKPAAKEGEPVAAAAPTLATEPAKKSKPVATLTLARDAIAEEDATPDIIEDWLEEEDGPPERRAPTKKKSWLPLVLLLVAVLFGLLALGTVALALWYFSSSTLSNRQTSDILNLRTNIAPVPLPDSPVARIEQQPDKSADKAKVGKPEVKSQPVKPEVKSQPVKPEDKSQPVKPVSKPDPKELVAPDAKEIEEEIRRAGEGVKLVPVDVTIGGVPFTVNVPEGTKAAPGFQPGDIDLKQGDSFKIIIKVGKFNAGSAKEHYNQEAQNYRLKSVLLDTKDLLVSEHSLLGGQPPTFHFTANKMLGHLDFRFESDWYNTEKFKPLGRTDCMLMVHCARTATLKETYQAPDSPEALKKLGITLEITSGGKATRVAIRGPFSDATLPYLVKAAPDLEELNLNGGAQVGDEGLQHLAGLPKLRILSLGSRYGDDRMDGSGLVHLKNLTNLQELQLGATGIKGENLGALKGLTGLKRLDLYNNRIDDAGLENLEPLTNLEYLNLDNTPVTSAGLKHLRGLTKLRVLQLGFTKVDETGLESLQGLTQLEILDLNNTPCSDAGLKHLAGLTKLFSLGLSNTAVTDQGIAHLQSCKGLKSLNLSGTKITDAVWKSLARLENLENLQCNKTALTGVGAADLKVLTKLSWLNLSQTKVNNEGLAQIKELESLTFLQLDETQVSDAGLAELKGLKKLQHLFLVKTPVTDAGLEHLQGLTALTGLMVFDTKVTKEGATKLKKALPKLEISYRTIK